MNCRGLSGITLPSTLESIASQAFYSCTGLTGELVIPSSVMSIEAFAFKGCKFTSISVDNTRGAISGAPWGWSGGADAVIWLRQ